MKTLLSAGWAALLLAGAAYGLYLVLTNEKDDDDDNGDDSWGGPWRFA